MHRTKSLIGVLAAAAALAACDSPLPSGPEAAGADEAAALQANARPASPTAAGGAMIIRGPVPALVVHLDQQRELLSVHAPSSVCGAGSVNFADAQFITTPSEIEQFLAQLKDDDAAVSVYRASSFAEAGIDADFDFGGIPDIVDFGAFCSFLVGPDRIAEGTVRRVSNLSNASFSVSWTGELDAVAGGTVRLTEVYQLTASALEPADESQWSVNTSKVLLH